MQSERRRIDYQSPYGEQRLLKLKSLSATYECFYSDDGELGIHNDVEGQPMTCWVNADAFKIPDALCDGLRLSYTITAKISAMTAHTMTFST
eukprot:COSAG01_NODE_4116_length_5335_cov_5.918067_2_plen_92_part_00